MLIGGFNRTVGLSRVQFFVADHILVSTLKLCVKSTRISRCNHTLLHLEKLKELAYAHEYAVTDANWFNVLSSLEDRVKLWDH